MKTFLFLIAFSFFCNLNTVNSQCGRISLIGEFNQWSEDLFLNRDPVDPDEFSIVLVLTNEDDYDGNGIIEMKFRENAGWENNWGSTQFPSGNAILNGPNIPVPVGSYLVTFNCGNLHYEFQSTCGVISLIGEFSGWAEDWNMTRDPLDPELWTIDISLVDAMDIDDPPGIISVKFRENADWMVNWGSDDFPSGVGCLNCPNIHVPLTSTGISTDYHVMFNCSSWAFNFIETSGPISLYGEFSDWTEDHFLERNTEQYNLFSGIISLNAQDDFDGDGIVEMKFRENADNTLNWGSSQFPSGTAVLNGENFQVPLDNNGISTDYLVTFDFSTLAFSFQATSGNITIVGEFLGWWGDIPMNRQTGSPNVWRLTRCWYDDSEIKFRENLDWNNNWGSLGWPSGTGILNGPNIPLIAGTYDVTFNSATGAYSFMDNPDVCGEIGLIGDFNDWGVGQGGYASDIYLVRDPVYPSRFSLDCGFTASTGLLFRLNADPAFLDVWGGNSLCQTGVQDAEEIIQVSSGLYHITFDCNSGDYCITRLGNSAVAANVVNITVDGILNEIEWEFSHPVEIIIQGEPNNDLNEAVFGVLYNETYLYAGLKISDYYHNEDDVTEFFLDGNHSGGSYDASDVHFLLHPDGEVEVITGPPGGITIEAGLLDFPLSYFIEVAIPWDDLGVIPVEGQSVGFDIIIWDDDDGMIDYKLAWNGNVNNFLTTQDFGEVILGDKKCGCITLFNEVTGDVRLRPMTNAPFIYLATYDFDADYPVIFRKDYKNDFFWGSGDFPSGIAEPGGSQIPVIQGRYRINFNCNTGEYSFGEAPAGENLAMASYTEETPVIDGELDEYELIYSSDHIVSGIGPLNNIVDWGARWDEGSFYIGARVMDAVIFGNGSPWEVDAIEFYVDGNNDKDGVYDPDFDTHIIMDAWNESNPWFKPDGVDITNYDAHFSNTGLGYNVELRLGWSNFDFDPGKGRVMGWSLANNDTDDGTGLDYQTVWYGTDVNWSNTSVLGDLQLADGPYYTDIPKQPTKDNILVYPNPVSSIVTVHFPVSIFSGQLIVNVFNVSGQCIYSDQIIIKANEDHFQVNLDHAVPGLYIIRIYSGDGECYTKKLVVQ